MTLDKDLQSVQEVRELLTKAKEAQLAFRAYSQEQVDTIVRAMVDAGFAEAERLGRLAHEETGFGKPEDKKKKNEFATKRVCESIKDLKTVGVIREDREKRIIEIAEPMGVVAALIPSTNPTSTVMFKAIISVKGRNGFVASPHPRAVKCTLEATRVVSEAAERAGAPHGLIACMSVPTIEGTNELMKHKHTAVILATGSNPMVRAAYSSGKPALGVGSGNVPAFIERTANIKKAVADIVSGKMFDWGVLCSTESGVIVDSPVKTQVIEEFKRLKAYFVNPDEKEKLSDQSGYRRKVSGVYRTEGRLQCSRGYFMSDCRAAGGRERISAVARKTIPRAFDVYGRRMARRMRALHRNAGVRRIRTHDGDSFFGQRHYYEIRA
jgi:acetaldehyde dehydrogenase (acetylating)